MGALFRLLHAAYVLTREGVVSLLAPPDPPPMGRLALRIARWVERPDAARQSGAARLAKVLDRLGPSYIKLGQFLATRPDIVGPVVAQELTLLQDSMPPFSIREAKTTIRETLDADADVLFEELSPPLAAASIAQVHRAGIAMPATGGVAPDADFELPALAGRKQVAVKILRPGVEQRFARDLESFYLAARLAERLVPKLRRLRPVAVVDTLARTVELEMDLRLEAAALSEMAENVADDDGFRVPLVDWRRSGRRVLTLDWVDGIKLSNAQALREAGVDLPALAQNIIQSFLRHALRDGFFHADMHQGNLFVDTEGRLVAVDCGIMGRLGVEERRFLAEILYGFIRRDYRRVAEVHFEAGYVPAGQDVDMFAQALRAIGEPLQGNAAKDISMARLLTQLFEVTELFDMHTQPQLILLQKTMVVVEGVARSFDPDLNMWTTAEPVVRGWIVEHLGPSARLGQAGEGIKAIGRLVNELPALADRAESFSKELGRMSRDGVRLDAATVEALAAARARHGRSTRTALWVIAILLGLIYLAI